MIIDKDNTTDIKCKHTSELIKHLMSINSDSQKSFAERVRRNKNMINLWYNGEVSISFDSALDLCKKLDVSLFNLIKKRYGRKN